MWYNDVYQYLHVLNSAPYLLFLLSYRDDYMLQMPGPLAVRSIVRLLKWKHIVLFYETSTGIFLLFYVFVCYSKYLM